MQDSILSVSEFVEFLNQTLEAAYPSVNIEGEVSGYRGPNRNGHHYFTLKDAGANLECVAFAGRVPFELEDGMTIIVKGRPNHHPQYKFKFIANEAKPSGDGAIKRAYELLKKKLEAEGLFEISRKRALPKFPRRIGVVSSAQAAGFGDFIEILNKRWRGVEIMLADVQVQGDKAPGQIVRAIQYFNQLPEPIDILVVTRGGGSLEDLQAFSDETVVRAVAGSRTPTVVAVGHEVDISLSDLAADLRAATPSDAARLIVPDREEFMYQIGVYRRSMATTFVQGLADYRQHLNDLVSAMSERLSAPKQRIDELRVRLDGSLQYLIKTIGNSLTASQRILNSNNPRRLLKSGYSLARDTAGQLVTSVNDVSAKQKLMLELSDGQIDTEVIDAKKS